jgi:hypothetical protein
MKDDDTPGLSLGDYFPAVISGYWKISPHASYREIAKDLFVSKTIISGILEEIGSRFLIARLGPRTIG